MKNITLGELRTKREHAESVISDALNTFLKETGCEVELDIYCNKNIIGAVRVYVVKVKVEL